MKRESFALFSLICASAFATALGVSTSDHGTLESRTLASCTSSKLLCLAEELESKLDSFATKQADISARLAPINTVFGKVTDAKTKVGNLNTLIKSVSVALSVASNIPYVGYVFKAANTATGLLKTPIDKVDDAVKSATSTLITPWSNSVGKIMSTVESVVSTMQENMESLLSRDVENDMVDGLAKLADAQCVRNVLDTLAPKATAAFSSLETAIQDLIDELDDLSNDATKVINAIKKSTWTKFVATLESIVSTIDDIWSVFKGLSPLVDFIEKKINLPWVKITGRSVDGTPRFCPDGYMKGTFDCLKSCPSGYGSDHLGTCYSNCPSGYTDVGAACDNKYYKVRETKVRELKCSWDDGCTYKCPSGYSMSNYAVTCWKNCPDDYKSQDFGAIGVCYKTCPNSMGLDPTKKFCMKKTWKQSAKNFQCRDGYENILSLCYKKCPSGATTVGLVCITPTTVSFKISDIGNKLDEVMDTIKNLPIVKEIENAIKSLVMEVMEPILDFLGIPSPDDIITSITGALDDLPVASFNTKLQAISFDRVMDLMDLDDVIAQQAENLLKSVNIDPTLFTAPEGLNDCINDFSCISEKVGIDLPFSQDEFMSSLTTFTEEFQNDEVIDKVHNFTEQLDFDASCKSTTTTTINLAKIFSDAMGTTPPSQTCTMNLEVCTDYGFETPSATEALNSLRDAMDPLIQKIANIFPSNGRRRRLREAARETLDEKDIFDVDNFELPFFGMPVSPPLVVQSNLAATEAGCTFWLYHFQDADMIGNIGKFYLPPSYMIMYAGRKEGKTTVRIAFRFQADLFRFMHSKVPIVEEVRISLNRFFSRIEEIKTDPSIGAPQCFPKSGIAPFYCRQLVKLVEAGEKISEWEWEGISKRDAKYRTWGSIYSAHGVDDPWWKGTEGKLYSGKLVKFLRKYIGKMDSTLSKGSRFKFQNKGWWTNAKDNTKAMASYQAKRLLLSPTLFGADDTDVVTPYFGIQLMDYSRKEIGFQAWFRVLEPKVVERFRVYLPMPQKYSLPWNKKYSLDVGLNFGVIVNAFRSNSD